MANVIPMEISAKHVHLSKEAVEALFGAGYELTAKRDLSQPGQYLCEERVVLAGPKGEMKNVAILGPTRPATQVEISATDSRTLGVKPIVRESGDVAGSEPITLKSVDGTKTYDLNEGVIVAKNHIHMTVADAEKLGVTNGEIVGVRANTSRPVIFDDVVCRVNDAYALAMHIDFDEANACLCQPGTTGDLIKK